MVSTWSLRIFIRLTASLGMRTFVCYPIKHIKASFSPFEQGVICDMKKFSWKRTYFKEKQPEPLNNEIENFSLA